MSRRSARLAAVEVLYAADVRDVSPSELLAEREDCDAYCVHLVTGIEADRERLDRIVGDHARGWTTERMSPVDRNVLRVATFELFEGDVPVAVVIDEAIELSKRFSGEEAGRFVNGVLEAVRQAVGPGGSGERSGGGGGTASSDGGAGERGGAEG